MAALTTTFTTDAAMTVEVGTITGEVEVQSTNTDGGCRHRIRYVGADEWYQLEGESAEVADGQELQRVHKTLVDSLRAPASSARAPKDPPPGSQLGRDADDPAAGRFGGARRG